MRGTGWLVSSIRIGLRRWRAASVTLFLSGVAVGAAIGLVLTVFSVFDAFLGGSARGAAAKNLAYVYLAREGRLVACLR
jgi:hypothetical protein